MARGKRSSAASQHTHRIQCPHEGCSKTFRSLHSKTYHIRSMHTDPYYVPPPLSEPDHADRTAPGDNTPDLEPLPLPEVPPKQEQKIFHPHLSGA